MPALNDSNFIFLGICERAQVIQELNSYKWNILGLKHGIYSFIYPFGIDGLVLAINLVKVEK